jgi:hypothetical protein
MEDLIKPHLRAHGSPSPAGLTAQRTHPHPLLEDELCGEPAISHSSSVPVSRLLWSPFQLHNRHSRLLWGIPVESLQSHCIHTMFHWSSGQPVCFPSWGTRVQSPGGYLCETWIFLSALSRYSCPHYSTYINLTSIYQSFFSPLEYLPEFCSLMLCTDTYEISVNSMLV